MNSNLLQEAKQILEEARKIIRASSSRQLAKDWDRRATENLAMIRKELDQKNGETKSDPDVWGWAIVDKDGIEHKVRARLRDHFGAILESECFTESDLARLDVEFAGCAPHRIIKLYTDSK